MKVRSGCNTCSCVLSHLLHFHAVALFRQEIQIGLKSRDMSFYISFPERSPGGSVEERQVLCVHRDTGENSRRPTSGTWVLPASPSASILSRCPGTVIKTIPQIWWGCLKTIRTHLPCFRRRECKIETPTGRASGERPLGGSYTASSRSVPTGRKGQGAASAY